MKNAQEKLSTRHSGWHTLAVNEWHTFGRYLTHGSDGFIQALNELLASGEATLTQAKEPEEPRPGVTVVGYEDNAYIYLLPEISYREAMRIRPLKFSTAAIGSQLKEEGWLVPSSSESHLTVQLRVRGRRVRVWRLKTDLFGDREDDINPASEERI